MMHLYPEGMGTTPTNIKLFKIPYYYEIRNFFYAYLREHKTDFHYAFWELEAADTLGSWDIRAELLEFKSSFFGELASDGATYFSGKPNSYYLDKRYYDGLVISEQIYNETGQLSEFEVFKTGYYWTKIPAFNF